MTHDEKDDPTITTESEFEAHLADIVERAVTQEVDVRGAWTFRTRGSTHDWEVEIYELLREPDGGDPSPDGGDPSPDGGDGE